MYRVQSKYIPMRCKTTGRKRPGWWSSEIRNTIKEKQKVFIRFKITGLELDLYHYRISIIRSGQDRSDEICDLLQVPCKPVLTCSMVGLSVT